MVAEPLFVRSYMNEDWPAGKGRYLDPDWLEYRVRLYLTYTLPSLLRQTDRDFRIWLDCRPGSEDELRPYFEILDELEVLLTFDRGKHLVNNLPGRPSHCYVTRLDSDDCYAPDAVELIKKHQGKREASQFTRGFVYFVAARYAYPLDHRSPPCYTLRLPITRNGPETRPHAGHNAVRDTFAPVILPAGKYCMLRHGRQGSRQPIGPPSRWYRGGSVERIDPASPEWPEFAAAFVLENQEEFWRRLDYPLTRAFLGV